MESHHRRLVHLYGAARNRSAQLCDRSVIALNKRLIGQIKKQIEQIDLLIKELIEQSAELSIKAQKLTAMTGVSSPAPQHCFWPRCPSREAAIGAKPLPWQGWLRLIATAATCAANAPSSAVVGLCALASTWRLWSRLGTTRSWPRFLNNSAPLANRPNSLSPPPCENSYSSSIAPSNPNLSSLELKTVTTAKGRLSILAENLVLRPRQRCRALFDATYRRFAAPAIKRSRETIARLCVPRPISPAGSRATTSKTKSFPSRRR